MTWQQTVAYLLLAALIYSVIYSIASTVRDRRAARKNTKGATS